MLNVQRIYLDTNALIGILENSDELDRAQELLVQDIGDGKQEAATSELALAECLIKPIADQDEALVRNYLQLLAADSKFLRVVPVTREIILEAARVRAGTRIKLPDAIHVATAKMSHCDAFVSNDKRLASAATIPFRLWNQLDQP